MIKIILFGALIGCVFSKVYLKENFDSDFTEKWVISDWKKSEGQQGEWKWTAGDWPVDENNKGVKTTQDARFYAMTTKFDEVFDNEGKDLVLQFSVKHEQKMDCGGGYIKLLAPDTDQTSFKGESPYSIMFGPDICGYSTKKVHAIFHHKGKNLEKKEEVSCPDDEFTHFYTLIVKPDDTYEIRIDNEKKASGNLKDDWEFEQPKKIKDPQAKKPSDWVDEEMMDDPNDKKPEDWDKEPEKIADPDAKKPEDWDEEEDGTWEAPMISNPKYKGEWKPKKIKNPKYKGQWVHPEIDNPDYSEEKDVYKRGPLGIVGFELWQVKSGTVFDNILVADDVVDAETAFKTNQIKKEDEEKVKKAFDDKNAPKEESKKDDDEETEKDDEDEKDDMKELDDDKKEEKSEDKVKEDL